MNARVLAEVGVWERRKVVFWGMKVGPQVEFPNSDSVCFSGLGTPMENLC